MEISRDFAYRLYGSVAGVLIGIGFWRRSRLFHTLARDIGISPIYEVGVLVRIRNSAKNPLAGQSGTIIAVSSADPYGPYLVEFEDGLRFRYHASEFLIPACTDAVQENPRGVGV